MQLAGVDKLLFISCIAFKFSKYESESLKLVRFATDTYKMTHPPKWRYQNDRGL